MNSVSLELLSKYVQCLMPIAIEGPSRLPEGGCPQTIYLQEETVALATYLAILKSRDDDIFLVI